jgi:glycolate oxidase subunit GlcD
MLQFSLLRNMVKNVRKTLEGIVGKENVKVDRVDLLCYSNDMTPYKYEPDILVFPKTTEEISKILHFANSRKIPVTTRGAGTSVVGGVLPRRGGIVLDMTKMDKIKKIAVEDLYVVVEPGVVLDKLNKVLLPHGLFFPPDTGSSSTCTIGGMAAANASGVHAVKYGTTKDWILGLEVVLADGRVIKTGGPVSKTSSGYNLTHLFVGSEGTLGVITELTLKLNPIPPYKATVSVFFDDLEKATKASTEIMLAGVRPAAMELTDKTCIGVINEVFNLGLPKAEGLLFVELDGYKKHVKEGTKEVIEICRKMGGKNIEWTDDLQKYEKIWEARKALVASLARLKEGYVLVHFAEDPVFPLSEVKNAIKEFQKISKKYGITVATFGHTGDGNLHPVMIINPEDPEEWRKVKLVEKEFMDVLFKKGGTISAEHGIGMSKIPFVRTSLGTSLDVMKKVKEALDPNNILNPGKLGLDTEDREDPGHFLYQGLTKIRKGFFLEKYKNEITKCFRCGLCRATCPTFNQTKMESANARGKVLLSYFLLTGQLEPSEKLLEAFNLCTLCMHCTVACPAGVNVAEIVEAARRDLASKGFIHPVHKVIAKNILKHNSVFGGNATRKAEMVKSLKEAI